MRDSKGASANEYSTPQQYKAHFEKVSKERNEESDETRKTTIENIKDLREDTAAKVAAEELSSPITQEEILREWGKVKDGAPGIDNVRISYIRFAGKTTQEAVCNVMMDMVNKDPCEWEEMVKIGLVVPLFKKGSGQRQWVYLMRAKMDFELGDRRQTQHRYVSDCTKKQAYM